MEAVTPKLAAHPDPLHHAPARPPYQEKTETGKVKLTKVTGAESGLQGLVQSLGRGWGLDRKQGLVWGLGWGRGLGHGRGTAQ